MNDYIANYRGGRNESFMYGVDKETTWFDYDLTSAYTTIMSRIGTPKYFEGRSLSVNELNKLTNGELLYSYVIIKGSFVFPEQTKYPSIPV
jgi:hypothetical protein